MVSSAAFFLQRHCPQNSNLNPRSITVSLLATMPATMSKVGSVASYGKAAAPVGSAPQAMTASGCGLGRGGWYASPPNPSAQQTPPASGDVPGNIAAALMTAASKSGSPAMPPPNKKNRWSKVTEGGLLDSPPSQLTSSSPSPRSTRSTTSTQHPPLKLSSSGSGLAPDGGSGWTATHATQSTQSPPQKLPSSGSGLAPGGGSGSNTPRSTSRSTSRSTLSTKLPLPSPSLGSGLAPDGGLGSGGKGAAITQSLAFAEHRQRLAKGIGKGLKSDEGAEAADKEVEQAI